MSNIFLKSIMDERYCRKLTICGSAKNRTLKEKYQAYYTIKNNLVFAPVNYLAIKNDVETKENEGLIARHLANIHDKKMDLSEGIIVVTDKDGYYGSHTQREIYFASLNLKYILYTHINEEDKDKYYFNGDLTYPLYMRKEE